MLMTAHFQYSKELNKGEKSKRASILNKMSE